VGTVEAGSGVEVSGATSDARVAAGEADAVSVKKFGTV